MFIRGNPVLIFINRGGSRKEGSSCREQRAQGRRVLSHHSEHGPGLAGSQLAQEEQKVTHTRLRRAPDAKEMRLL